MKKKKLITLAIIILLIGLVLLSIYFNNKDGKPKIITNSICDSIETYKKDKESFMMLVMKDETFDLGEKIKQYPDLKIINISPRQISNKCVQKELDETSLKDVAETDTIAIVYKNGSYAGAFINPNDEEKFIDYLDSKEVIQKKEIQETTNLDDFKTKIRQEYILVLISEEEQREWVDKNAKETFTNYNYDIVDIFSTEGTKIYKYMQKNYEPGNYFPQAYYFKNNKIVEMSSVSNLKEDYDAFIDAVNKN